MKKLKKKYKFNKFQLAWLKALESGKYRKGYGALSTKDKSGHKTYCCLGVACEVYNKLNSQTPLKINHNGSNYAYDDENVELPYQVVDILKLIDNGGDFKQPVIDYDHLIDLNDVAKWSHRKIAKYIRQHPENLFTDA